MAMEVTPDSNGTTICVVNATSGPTVKSTAMDAAISPTSASVIAKAVERYTLPASRLARSQTLSRLARSSSAGASGATP